jgi:Pyridoxamine 5'-phosphate oxidase
MGQRAGMSPDTRIVRDVEKRLGAGQHARRLGRTMTSEETAALLALDVPARLATLEATGFPRITPLWFLWEGGAFWMTSVDGQPHLRNLARDPRAAICVDVEESRESEGVRPNRQVKGHGLAVLQPDVAGEWTRRITLKYLHGSAGEKRASARAAMPRIVIELRPERLITHQTP